MTRWLASLAWNSLIKKFLIVRIKTLFSCHTQFFNNYPVSAGVPQGNVLWSVLYKLSSLLHPYKSQYSTQTLDNFPWFSSGAAIGALKLMNYNAYVLLSYSDIDPIRQSFLTPRTLIYLYKINIPLLNLQRHLLSI